MAIFEKELKGAILNPGTPTYQNTYLQETVRLPVDVKSIQQVTVQPANDRNSWEFVPPNMVKLKLHEGTWWPWGTGVPPVFGHYVAWTVKIEYNVNQPPMAPGSVTYATRDVIGGNPLSVRWGSATDPDDNLAGYELQVSIGGAAWQTIAKTGTATLAYTYNVIKGSESVQFRVRAYDTDQLTSEWTQGPVVEVINNQGPVITGINNVGELGAKNSAFGYVYQVRDPDNDNVRVEESLNGVIFKTLTNVPQGTDITTPITDEMISGLSTNTQNRITIKASDDQGHTTYKYITFTRTNQPPTITSTKFDLGQVLTEFSHEVTVKDPDGDKVSVTWSIGETRLGSATITGEGKVQITIPRSVFMRLRPGQHSIRVEAHDGKDGRTAKNITFVRVVNRLHVRYTHESAAIDAKPNHILVVPTWKVASGAVPNVRVTNNAADANPVWEDATTAVLAGLKFEFANATKTAPKWKIAIEIKIEKGTSTTMSYLSGLGGAIE